MGCGASSAKVVRVVPRPVESRDQVAHEDRVTAAGDAGTTNLRLDLTTGHGSAAGTSADQLLRRDTPSETSAVARSFGAKHHAATSPPATPPATPPRDRASAGVESIVVLGEETGRRAVEQRSPVKRYHSRRTAPRESFASHHGGGGSEQQPRRLAELQRKPNRLPPLERQCLTSLADLPPLATTSGAPANGRRAVSEARLSVALAACSNDETRQLLPEARAGRRKERCMQWQSLERSTRAEEEAMRAQIFATKLMFVEGHNKVRSSVDSSQGSYRNSHIDAESD